MCIHVNLHSNQYNMAIMFVGIFSDQGVHKTRISVKNRGGFCAVD